MSSESKHITMHLFWSERPFYEGKLLTDVGHSISLKAVDELLENGQTIFLTEWPNRHVDLELKKTAKSIEVSVEAHMQMVRIEAQRLEKEKKEKE